MLKLLVAFAMTWSLFFTNYQPNVTSRYTYAIVTDSSVVEWKGSSPKVSHHGSFDVTSQGIEVVDGQVKGGTFIIPIASIKNYDLPKTIRPVLLKHLKSEDFFHMAMYPEATFHLTNVTSLEQPVANAIHGANMMVSGNFTMLGNTHPLSFPAKITFQDEVMTVEAQFKLDRTKWGMTHAADPSLENRHIFPEVDIHLKVYARNYTYSE